MAPTVTGAATEAIAAKRLPFSIVEEMETLVLYATAAQTAASLDNASVATGLNARWDSGATQRLIIAFVTPRPALAGAVMVEAPARAKLAIATIALPLAKHVKAVTMHGRIAVMPMELAAAAAAHPAAFAQRVLPGNARARAAAHTPIAGRVPARRGNVVPTPIAGPAPLTVGPVMKCAAWTNVVGLAFPATRRRPKRLVS